MKLFCAALAITLLLASCAAPQPEASDTPPVSEASVSPPPETPKEELPASPETESQPWRYSMKPLSPPAVPEEERRYSIKPCLIKLEPYLDGSYTDGVYTFLFEDDGTVLWNNSSGGTLGLGYVFTFEKKDIEKPLDKAALMETDEYAAACEKALNFLGTDYPDRPYIAHKDGDTWYLYYDYPLGGGSGESYWIDDRTLFVKVGADGTLSDFGTLKAAHIVWYDGYFYYVELQSDVLSTPGIGRVMRVDMDGENRKTIVGEPAYGTIQVTGGRVYYTSLEDGRAYSVDLDGKDKAPVSDMIVPVNHRVGLEFYEDVLISRYWSNSGYSYGIFAMPNYDAAPAIMDVNGRNLLTFPQELRGYDAYEVINWGGEESYYNEDSYGQYGMYFLFLRSNIDGSYWVYETWCLYDPSFWRYDWAREQWAAIAD